MIHAYPSAADSGALLRRALVVVPPPVPAWRQDARFFLSAYAWGLGLCYLLLG